MRLTMGLLACLLLGGCDEQHHEEISRPAAEAVTEAPESNALPTLPAIVLERPQPSLVDLIRQYGGSKAAVTFATNAEGVECTFQCSDREDRRRVQEVVTRMFGSSKGTVDPPTVTFKLQPIPAFLPNRGGGVTTTAANSDDINARLQQRREYEKAKELREIRDLQAEVAADEIALAGIANRAFAFTHAEILKAKKTRLTDLIAFYVNKHSENP